MRILHLPPACLPDKLLLWQHQMIHRIISACATGDPVTAYSNHAGFLVLMHHHVVDEMQIRRMTHDSPVHADYWATAPARRGVTRDVPLERIILDSRTVAEKILKRGMTGARMPLIAALKEFRRLSAATTIRKEMLVK